MSTSGSSFRAKSHYKGASLVKDWHSNNMQQQCTPTEPSDWPWEPLDALQMTDNFRTQCHVGDHGHLESQMIPLELTNYKVTLGK